MHRPGLRVAAEARHELARRGKATGMEFRVAAGQPDEIGGGVRRLVGQRRERQDLRARGAPARQLVRIGKGKRRILRQGNALGRRLGQRARRGGVVAHGRRL